MSMSSTTSIQVGLAVYSPTFLQAGVIYDTCPPAAGRRQRPSCSVVLVTGRDLGTFYAHEADELFLPLGTTSLQFSFCGVDQLEAAVREGYFQQAWREASHHARALGLTLGDPS